MLTLILAIACADIAPDDTATSLGGYADEKGRHLDGVRFAPERAGLRLTDVLTAEVVTVGRAHVVARYCDDGLVVIATDWITDGDVVTVDAIPGYDIPAGDYTCTLVTPIGRLTIPVLVE